jgi:hypothetical protein
LNGADNDTFRSARGSDRLLFRNDGGGTNIVIGFRGDPSDRLAIHAVRYTGKGLGQGLEAAGIMMQGIDGDTRIVFKKEEAWSRR